MQRTDDEDDSGHACTERQQDDRLRQTERDDSPHRNQRQHRVVNKTNIAAAPSTNPRAARPKNVSDRACHSFENVELRLEEYPDAEYGDDAAEDRALLSRDGLGQRCRNTQTANV